MGCLEGHAVRVVFGRSKYGHVSDLRQRLGWMSSDELVQYHTLRLLHKIVRDGEPECLATMYILSNFILSAKIGDRLSFQNCA